MGKKPLFWLSGLVLGSLTLSGCQCCQWCSWCKSQDQSGLVGTAGLSASVPAGRDSPAADARSVNVQAQMNRSGSHTNAVIQAGHTVNPSSTGVTPVAHSAPPVHVPPPPLPPEPPQVPAANVPVHRSGVEQVSPMRTEVVPELDTPAIPSDDGPALSPAATRSSHEPVTPQPDQPLPRPSLVRPQPPSSDMPN